MAYRTDPEAVAAVIPPPLRPASDPRVHVRCTDIHLEFGEFVYQEKVGYFAVDAMHDDQPGEYPLFIPIDLESAISISRERFGEPKKLAVIEMGRDDDHVYARITRNGVTFIEIAGDVVEELPVPEPYPARQWWFKFMPSVTGRGFDGDPLLVQVDQVRIRSQWSVSTASWCCATCRRTQWSIYPFVRWSPSCGRYERPRQNLGSWGRWTLKRSNLTHTVGTTTSGEAKGRIGSSSQLRERTDLGALTRIV